MAARMLGLGLSFPALEGEQQQQEGLTGPAEQHQREKQLQNQAAGRKGEGGGGGEDLDAREERSSGGTDNGSNSSSPVGVDSSRSSSAFSSAPASAGRCSFRSDHDALFSQLSVHLAGRGPCSDPDPDRAKRWPSFDTTTPDKPRECQNGRFRSEAPASPAEGKKHRRQRPTSLDLNGHGSDVPFSSPGILTAGAGLTNSCAMSVRSRSGTFPSPGTPNYCLGGGGGGAVGYQKGWSSERVPLPAHSGRRHGNGSALLPFGNGRALPSKWEDAEKWIFSPVSGEGGIGRSSGPPPNQRRPKSKSGPLGTPVGMGSCYSSASPLMPGFDRRKIGNFTVGSPLLTGVLVTERGCCDSVSSGKCGSGSEGVAGVREGGRRSYSAQAEQGIARSASVHGWSDLLMESSSSLPSSQDEKLEGSKDATPMISPVILRKDVATQMSPEHSTQTSPNQRRHFSPPPLSSSPTIEEFQSHLSKLEFRDVQVDDRVTLTRWSKKHIACGTDKCSANIIQWKKKAVESRASSWKVAETAKCISKFKREEAKITAWENLQKAKAEAEIRKLEMKIEKMRSSSMDKIMNKLRSAQRKAQEKRNAVATSQANQVARTAKKVSSCRKAGQMGSLSGCFTCHAF